MRYDFTLLHNDALLYRYFEDQAAFTRIVTALRGYVGVAIRRSCIDNNEDVMQNTWCDIHRFLQSKSWDPARQPFPTTVKRVISNAIRNNYNAQKRNSRRIATEAISLSVLAGDSEVAFDIEDLRANFEERALNHVCISYVLRDADPLTKSCAELVLSGLDLSEVGEWVGLSSSGVRYRLTALGRKVSNAHVSV